MDQFLHFLCLMVRWITKLLLISLPSRPHQPYQKIKYLVFLIIIICFSLFLIVSYKANNLFKKCFNVYLICCILSTKSTKIPHAIIKYSTDYESKTSLKKIFYHFRCAIAINNTDPIVYTGFYQSKVCLISWQLLFNLISDMFISHRLKQAHFWTIAVRALKS